MIGRLLPLAFNQLGGVSVWLDDKAGLFCVRFNLSKLGDEPVLDFGSRPGGSAEEFETGRHGRVEHETPNRNAAPHLTPSMTLHELFHAALQSDTVQRIPRVRRRGWRVGCHCLMTAMRDGGLCDAKSDSRIAAEETTNGRGSKPFKNRDESESP